MFYYYKFNQVNMMSTLILLCSIQLIGFQILNVVSQEIFPLINEKIISQPEVTALYFVDGTSTAGRKVRNQSMIPVNPRNRTSQQRNSNSSGSSKFARRSDRRLDFDDDWVEYADEAGMSPVYSPFNHQFGYQLYSPHLNYGNPTSPLTTYGTPIGPIPQMTNGLLPPPAKMSYPLMYQSEVAAAAGGHKLQIPPGMNSQFGPGLNSPLPLGLNPPQRTPQDQYYNSQSSQSNGNRDENNPRTQSSISHQTKKTRNRNLRKPSPKPTHTPHPFQGRNKNRKVKNRNKDDFTSNPGNYGPTDSFFENDYDEGVPSYTYNPSETPKCAKNINVSYCIEDSEYPV